MLTPPRLAHFFHSLSYVPAPEQKSVHSSPAHERLLLISLALALGLSSLSSNNLKVESLFIDEGFGSLDAESLRTAMEALEQLQMQGRKIGVISHVQEMSERISVQVQVHKKVNGKRDSTFRLLLDKEDKPKASAKEIRNDSPPEREYTVRISSHISQSIT